MHGQNHIKFTKAGLYFEPAMLTQIQACVALNDSH